MKAISNMPYFAGVDILRGFAAVSVLVYHVVIFWEWRSFPVSGPLSWFRIGWMGVDLFFIISGVVIGLTAFAAVDRDGPRAFRAIFVKRRLLRIAPLYYLTSFFFVVLVVPETIHSGFWANALTHALFIHNLFPAWHGAINGVTWSLGVEMQFYALMLVLAPWLRQASCWRILASFVAVAWLWRYSTWAIVAPRDTASAVHLWLVSTQLPGLLDEFVAGILTARFIRSERGRAALDALSKHRGHWLVAAALVAIILWLLLQLFWAYASFWYFPWLVTFFRTLLGGVFAGLVILACAIPVRNFPLPLSGMRYLGTISFGIYLWHLPVVLLLKKLIHVTPLDALALTLCFTLTLAAISWQYFERPLIQRYRGRD